MRPSEGNSASPGNGCMNSTEVIPSRACLGAFQAHAVSVGDRQRRHPRSGSAFVDRVRSEQRVNVNPDRGSSQDDSTGDPSAASYFVVPIRSCADGEGNARARANQDPILDPLDANNL